MYLVVGNGTEDISCRMDQSNWQVAEGCSGTFSKAESASFFHRLNIHFISFLVYPRVFTSNPNFCLRIGEVPPVMNPRVSGDILFDTEYQASSIFHQNYGQKGLGKG